MKQLLLFDIDGTIVSGGPAKQAFHEALLETFRTAGAIEVHEFSGKTDPQIARELLVGAGIPDEQVDAGLPDLFDRYLAGLEARLPESPMRILPGVIDLVHSLDADPEVGLGLVTGNVARGARLKLASTGVADRFRVGGYGSDAEERNDLPGIALRRAEESWGIRFNPAAVVVIGDTPRDIECGQAHGLRTLAVATGNYSADQLAEAGPDHVVEDFADVDRVLEWLRG